MIAWATELLLFASPLSHAVTLPFEKHAHINLIYILGQMVSLFAFAYLIRYSKDWYITLTSSIVTAWLLPHFLLNTEAVRIIRNLLHLPHKNWSNSLVGLLVCAFLFGAYYLMMDMTSALA